ncbi:MAG TPA: DUF2846 domain-containing protein [Burkholderiales bacterium]|nr:DUF2846 domain-containing protein [Burkholderiales bacterium]
MSFVRALVSAAAAAYLLAVVGCTSTPQAPPEKDVFAKEFPTHPNASTIYVYRSPFNQFDFDSVLYLNGRLIGTTVPGAYFRVDVTPGRNVLHGSGVDIGEIALDTRAGEIYFVSVDVVGGHSNFRVMPQETGKQRVRACCALLENWAPGQRPFVR